MTEVLALFLKFLIKKSEMTHNNKYSYNKDT